MKSLITMMPAWSCVLLASACGMGISMLASAFRIKKRRVANERKSHYFVLNSSLGRDRTVTSEGLLHTNPVPDEIRELYYDDRVEPSLREPFPKEPKMPGYFGCSFPLVGGFVRKAKKQNTNAFDEWLEKFAKNVQPDWGDFGSQKYAADYFPPELVVKFVSHGFLPFAKVHRIGYECFGKLFTLTEFWPMMPRERVVLKPQTEYRTLFLAKPGNRKKTLESFLSRDLERGLGGELSFHMSRNLQAVVKGIEKQYGDPDWVVPSLIKLFQRVNAMGWEKTHVQFVSHEIRLGSRLLSWELGVVYKTIYTHIYRIDEGTDIGLDTLQTWAIMNWLVANKFDYYDMGEAAQYKTELGFYKLPRKEWIHQVEKIRDRGPDQKSNINWCYIEKPKCQLGSCETPNIVFPPGRWLASNYEFHGKLDPAANFDRVDIEKIAIPSNGNQTAFTMRLTIRSASEERVQTLLTGVSKDFETGIDNDVIQFIDTGELYGGYCQSHILKFPYSNPRLMIYQAQLEWSLGPDKLVVWLLQCDGWHIYHATKFDRPPANGV